MTEVSKMYSCCLNLFIFDLFFVAVIEHDVGVSRADDFDESVNIVEAKNSIVVRRVDNLGVDWKHFITEENISLKINVYWICLFVECNCHFMFIVEVFNFSEMTGE